MDKTNNKQKKKLLKSYRKEKIDMLKEFCINLSEKEMEYLLSLTTEIAIDNFCIKLINDNIKTHV